MIFFGDFIFFPAFSSVFSQVYYQNTNCPVRLRLFLVFLMIFHIFSPRLFHSLISNAIPHPFQLCLLLLARVHWRVYMSVLLWHFWDFPDSPHSSHYFLHFSSLASLTSRNSLSNIRALSYSFSFYVEYFRFFSFCALWLSRL